MPRGRNTSQVVKKNSTVRRQLRDSNHVTTLRHQFEHQLSGLLVAKQKQIENDHAVMKKISFSSSSQESLPILTSRTEVPPPLPISSPPLSPISTVNRPFDNAFSTPVTTRESKIPPPPSPMPETPFRHGDRFGRDHRRFSAIERDRFSEQSVSSQKSGALPVNSVPSTPASSIRTVLPVCSSTPLNACKRQPPPPEWFNGANDSDCSYLEPVFVHKGRQFDQNSSYYSERSISSRPREIKQNTSVCHQRKQSFGGYTTSLASIPAPNIAFHISSQRRVPYNPDYFRFNAKAFGSPSRRNPLQKWDPRRLDLDNSILSFETTNEYISDTDFERFIGHLERKLHREESHLSEARDSIAYWRQREGRKNSMNEVCGHALQLISENRLNTYVDLICRAQTFQQMKVGPPPIVHNVRSTFTIFNLDISLDRHYYSASGDDKLVFMIIGCTNEKIIASQILESEEINGLRSAHLIVKDSMVFKDLPLNFQIRVEFYYMKANIKSSAPKTIAKKALNMMGIAGRKAPSRGLNGSTHSSRHGDEELEGFQCAGFIFLNRDSIGQMNVMAENITYPFNGWVSVTSKCTALPAALRETHQGFWKLYCGPDYTEMFVILTDGLIRFYDKKQDQNSTTAPTFIVDLSTICDHVIVQEPDGNTEAGDFAFYMDLISFPRGSDMCEQRRILVGFGDDVQLQYWITTLNMVLGVIRGSR